VIDEGLDATSKDKKELGMPSHSLNPRIEIIVSITLIVGISLLMRRR